MKSIPIMLFLFFGFVQISLGENDLIEYENDSFNDRITEITGLSEKVEEIKLLAWYRYYREVTPRSERIFVYIKTKKNSHNTHYLAAMSRSYYKPNPWTLFFIEIEFKTFFPVRKFNELPKPSDAEELFKYVHWKWHSKICWYNIVSYVNKNEWKNVFGDYPKYQTNNKFLVCGDKNK